MLTTVLDAGEEMGPEMMLSSLPLTHDCLVRTNMGKQIIINILKGKPNAKTCDWKCGSDHWFSPGQLERALLQRLNITQIFPFPEFPRAVFPFLIYLF